MSAFDWILFVCVVLLALAGAYIFGENRILRAQIMVLYLRLASEKQRAAWLESELGATEDEAQDVERWR